MAKATKKIGPRKKSARPAPQPVGEAQRIRTAKGHRPTFSPDESTDKLVAMLMALVGEVAVLRERLDTHERLAESEVWPRVASVESFAAADEVAAQRAEWRDAYVARIMRVITDELERLKS